jgi:hypothetical protein
MEISPLANTNTETRVLGTFYNSGVTSIGKQRYIENMLILHWVDAAGSDGTPRKAAHHIRRHTT